jgi:hypothetical protein
MACWNEVRALQGKTLRTLDRHKPFGIMAASESEVLLRLSTGKVRSVGRAEIEGAFDALQRAGEINLQEIEKRHSARSMAYVASILAELGGVEYRVRPVRLLYHAKQAGDAKPRKAGRTSQGHPALSPTSVNVLRLIAEGRTYEQILALRPELTYPDIFGAAREALAIAGEDPNPRAVA